MTRKVKNQRLAAVGYVWAFSALNNSPGARAHYDRRRKTNERHTAAQRNLFNRLIGILYHCLQAGQAYDEQKAFQTSPTAALAAAAFEPSLQFEQRHLVRGRSLDIHR